MYKYINFIRLYIFLFLGISCSTQRSVTPSLAFYQKQPVKFVPLRTLLLERGKYNGQIIETDGYLSFGFENSALYYDSSFSFKDSTLLVRMYDDALWIDLHPRYAYYYEWPEDLKGKYVKVRGVLDSSGHGHMGMYTAELHNTFYVNEQNP